MLFRPLLEKVGLVLSAVRTYNKPLDVVTFLLLFGGMAAGILLGWLKLNRHMMPALVLVVVLFVVMPRTLIGGGFADDRTTLVIAFLAVVCTAAAAPPRRLALVAMVVVGFLVAARVAVVQHAWNRLNPLYAELDTALRALPEGAAVFPVLDATSDANVEIFPAALQHLACLAVISRDAFVPSLFTFASQFVLRLQPDYQLTKLRVRPLYPGGNVDWQFVRCHYSHLVIFQRPPFRPPLPLDFRRVASGELFALFSLPLPDKSVPCDALPLAPR
jgi:hypothetical protein